MASPRASEAPPGPLPGDLPWPPPGAQPRALPKALPDTLPRALPGPLPGAFPGAHPGTLPGALLRTLPGALPETSPRALPRPLPGTFPRARPAALPLALLRALPGALRRALPGALLALFLAVPAAAAPPERVVSVNLCTDQLAMLLAAPGQLISVSHLARDPRSSAMAAEAAAFPTNAGRAEDVYLLAPDLVLAGSFTTPASVALLRRLGLRVETFPHATSLADVGAQLRQMGTLLGREAEAEALATRLDRKSVV